MAGGSHRIGGTCWRRARSRQHRTDIRVDVRTEHDRYIARHSDRHFAGHNDSGINADTRNDAAGHGNPNARDREPDPGNHNSRNDNSGYNYARDHTCKPNS